MTKSYNDFNQNLINDLPANAGDGLADDPQVKAVFGVVESLGLGEVPPELKRRSLNMGAATRVSTKQNTTSMAMPPNMPPSTSGLVQPIECPP